MKQPSTYYQHSLKKALQYLKWSYQKTRSFPTDPAQLDEEKLEAWESFGVRFSRALDLFLTKYLKALVWENDPGMEFRALRNIATHTYEQQLQKFFEKLRAATPYLLDIEKKL